MLKLYTRLTAYCVFFRIFMNFFLLRIFNYSLSYKFRKIFYWEIYWEQGYILFKEYTLFPNNMKNIYPTELPFVQNNFVYILEYININQRSSTNATIFKSNTYYQVLIQKKIKKKTKNLFWLFLVKI